MFRKTHHSFVLHLSSALLALMLLSGCNTPRNIPAPVAVQAEATQAAVPTSIATMVERPTEAAPGQANSVEQNPVQVTVDVSGVAQLTTSQTVAAVQAGANVVWTAVMPEHTELTLQGYPITNHLKTPQIFVYPVQDLGVSDMAVKQAGGLRTLLQNQQPGDQLPYLPLQFSAKQVIHPQVKYLDFKNGKGVRFLTQWGNGMSPINNLGLLYTYQGLTSDGKYYLAAVLPVNLAGLLDDSLSNQPAQPPAILFPALPTSSSPSDQEIQDFGSQYRQYLSDSENMLDQQPASAYTPDLSKLDAMMQSIEIK
jgi:hypothetical protein